jgi:integrase
MIDDLINLEPTFADVIQSVTSAADVKPEKRRHWRTSLTAIAKALDQPPAVIPGRYSAVRARMAALHHVPLGWTPKTLANHKSNAKAAVLWFAKEKDLPQHGVALLPTWEVLLSQLTDPSTRYRLLPLMRFCSGVGIGPEAVDETVIDRYLDYRSRGTARKSDDAARRILAKLWNGCIGIIAGWPTVRLLEPPMKSAAGLTLADFPEPLLADIERYLGGLAALGRKDQNGRRRRPCKPSTILMRKRELMAAVRMADKVGVPVKDITSIAALVHPDVAEKVLDGYWRQDGEVPKTYTINLSERFVGIGRAVGLSEEDLQRLIDLHAALEPYRQEGMTPKNLALIRLVLTDGVWQRIVGVVEELMDQARQLRSHAPIRAGVLAQIAVAVAILTVAPIRLGNLAAIRLGENLNKPGGPRSNYWLQFTRYDVKNNKALSFKLDDVVSEVIDEYMHDFRPALLRGHNGDWLFPGETGGHKEKISFSTQIVERIEKATGIRITVHQFRHAAGALILKHHPGNYELVRRILGHKSVQTTINFYCDLETTQASEIYTDILRNHVMGP